MSTRALNPNDPELLSLAEGASVETARSVACFAASTALRHNPVSDPTVLAVLEALDGSADRVALGASADIERLAERHDERYFELLEAAGGRYTPEVLQEFGKARALTSLASALSDDPRRGVIAAIYEAYVSLGDTEADAFLAHATSRLRAVDQCR